MRPLDRVSIFVVVILSFAFLGLYGYVAGMTLAYPFQLEWMEGGTVDVIQRICNGQPVYQKPTLSYVPYIYTPLYYHVSAVLTALFGVGFLTPRLLSCVASTGVGLIIYRWGRCEGLDRSLAFAGAGAFFATFALSGYWFHLARNDSLSLFLLLSGTYFAYHRRRVASGAMAAGLLWLAFLAKQSTLPASIAVLAAVCLFRPARGFAALGFFLVVSGLTTVIYSAATDGWFFFFVFELPTLHETMLRKLTDFWLVDVFPWWTIASLMSGAFVVLTLRENWRKGVFYAALSGSTIAVAWSGRIHEGGHVNVLMPMHAVLSLMMVLTVGKLRVCGRGMCASSDVVSSRRSWAGAITARVGAALAAAQMLLLLYDPSAAIPTGEDRAGGREFLNRIASYAGDVFIPSHRYVQTRVGKKSYGLGMASYDLLRARGATNAKQGLLRELYAAVIRRNFSAIVLQEQDGLYYPVIFEHYEWKEAILPGRYLPVAGPAWRPDQVYVPRDGRSQR